MPLSPLDEIVNDRWSPGADKSAGADEMVSFWFSNREIRLSSSVGEILN